jgi:hypothetical protein
LAVTASNASNNNIFLKCLTMYVIKRKSISIKKNNLCYFVHIINLTVQEILKCIKAGDAQEENEILELILQEEQEENHVKIEIIPRLRRLIVKLQSSSH